MSTTQTKTKQQASPLEAIQEALIEKRTELRFSSEYAIQDFLANCSHDEQLGLAQGAVDQYGQEATMQALAYSEHEDVQEAVLDWLESDEVSDLLVAAILCDSDFEDIAARAADSMDFFCSNLDAELLDGNPVGLDSSASQLTDPVISPADAVRNTLISKRQSFHMECQRIASDYLDFTSEDEQLEAVEEAIADGHSVAMQVFAASEHESVLSAVLGWLEADDVYDPLVASILNQSEHEEIAERASDAVEECCENVPAMTQFFLSFT